MAVVFHFLSVELDNEVAFLESGFGGRRIGHHLTDQRSILIGQTELFRQLRRYQRLELNAQKTAHHFAIPGEALHDAARQIDRNGESNALIAAAAADDKGVEPDQTPFGVHQCATRVAGVD